jgi:gentisate 1,2-dioxygenase
MNASAVIIDRTGQPIADNRFDSGRPSDVWPPITITAAQIDALIQQLADHPRPANGRREAKIVHPQAVILGQGLTPGIQVVLSVLLPGEETTAVRQNSTQVNFCIKGAGHALIGEKRIDFGRYDVWNVPSFVPYRHANHTQEVQVRLTYSNAPLLEMLRVHLVDDSPDAAPAAAAAAAAHKDAAVDDPRRKSPFGSFQLTTDGAWLMPYEILINPQPVNSPTLHWPWAQVRSNLDKLAALGKDYIGRRLYLLYNPMTGRSNGTTPSFFATMTVRPPRIIDRPHRHASAAINYYFHGSGYSVVDGERYEWQAGDLMLSAPGWAVHNHASYDDPVYELTIQDQPMHIMTESLLWQESLKEPPALLGANAGFMTNRSA